LQAHHLALAIVFFGAELLLGQSTVQQHSNRLQELRHAFPQTVGIKNHGKLLEFCPDGTCDGFVASGDVSAMELSDFAFLYVYFFSDYTYLADWRGTETAQKAADRVLAERD
jgi:hypothetical protein